MNALCANPGKAHLMLKLKWLCATLLEVLHVHVHVYIAWTGAVHVLVLMQ